MVTHPPPEAGTIEFDIRNIRSDSEYAACLALQEQTWGVGFSEMAPPGIIKIAQKVGGIAAAAFGADGGMAGFVFGISGIREGRPAHWSHMLAVRPEFRNRGVGRRLKEYQRDRLLEMGIERMYWTFDPLVARNAHLNINRLGVTIDQYVENMYSGGDRGSLDSVIGTDRFIANWDLTRTVHGPGVKITNLPGAGVVRTDGPTPRVELGSEPYPSELYVEIPPSIHQLKAEDPDTAMAWREATRKVFVDLVERGYRVAGFGKEEESGRYAYLLTLGEC